jgi:CheY-like chemotaxis protein
MELERIPFDLHDIFAYCRAAIAQKAEDKGLILYCYAEPSVGRKLLGDPLRLRQVLVNMLTNAVKFTNVGAVKLLASIKSQTEDTVTMSFEVKDSGIGMNPEQIERIFAPFSQADESISRRYGGTGLGLAICMSFIDMMGGKLTVESAQGLGSKFSFEVTFDTVSEAESGLSGNGLTDEMEKLSFKGEVLICEDNYLNQRVICEYLERAGLGTVVARDGKEGVEIVSARMRSGGHPFDLIFMDIHMPIMDGLEAAAHIASLGVKTPIVALTANIMANEIEMYAQSGMQDYLGKPFTPQELWACLMKYIPAQRIHEPVARRDPAGDEEMLLQFRRIFVKNNQNTFADIKKALDGGDVKNAHRLAHTLKSNAAQLGEKGLREAAASAEAALAGGENLLSKRQSDVLEAELSAVLEKLAALLADDKTGTRAEDAGPRELGGEELADTLGRLKVMLENRNPECLDLLDGIRGLPGAGDFVRKAENLNFKQALEALSEFMESR